MKKLAVILVLLLCALLFGAAINEMPRMGDANNPTNTHIVPRYLEKGPEEAGAKNIVTAVILNYRGYDTLGEVTVIFTALCAVLAVLRREDLENSFSEMDTSSVKSSVIIYTVLLILLPFIILFGIYVILHGGSSPGGGFQGGTILAAGLIVYTLIFGYRIGLKKLPLKVRTVLESAGPISFFLVGSIGFIFGHNFLTFMSSSVSSHYQHILTEGMLTFLEIGIGVGGGTIFTSIFTAMRRTEKA